MCTLTLNSTKCDNPVFLVVVFMVPSPSAIVQNQQENIVSLLLIIIKPEIQILVAAQPRRLHNEIFFSISSSAASSSLSSLSPCIHLSIHTSIHPSIIIVSSHYSLLSSLSRATTTSPMALRGYSHEG